MFVNKPTPLPNKFVPEFDAKRNGVNVFWLKIKKICTFQRFFQGLYQSDFVHLHLCHFNLAEDFLINLKVKSIYFWYFLYSVLLGLDFWLYKSFIKNFLHSLFDLIRCGSFEFFLTLLFVFVLKSILINIKMIGSFPFCTHRLTDI